MPELNFLKSDSLSETQKEGLFHLWNKAYPVNLSFVDLSALESYLQKLEEARHWTIEDNKSVKGWASCFTRENETWFAMILDESIQGKGLGSRLLTEMKALYPILNGWVIDHDRDLKANGKVYSSPLSFYLKNEFKVLQELRLELPSISAVKIVWKA